MKDLTGLPQPPIHGSSREYQRLPGGDEASLLQNPFNSEGNDSVDSRSSMDSASPVMTGPTGLNSSYRQGTLSSSPNSTARLQSVASGEMGRYPQQQRLSAAAAAAAGDAAGSRGSNRYSRSSSISQNSMGSYNQEGNPFLSNTDFSPFGGYPASDFPLHMDEKEADDYLHNPDPTTDARLDRRCVKPDKRGALALIAFILLVAGAIMLFIVLPVLTFSGVTIYPAAKTTTNTTSTDLVDTPYSYGILKAVRTSLIDEDTPSDAKTMTAANGDTWNLVFSDEFNVDGRTFYPNDDPYWTAVDIWYGATQDLEWYSPDAVTTANGKLLITLDAFENHDLSFRSGMMQSWNKLCFTQGHIEIGARLPGSGSVPGFWPGLWTLGNLGRPGYRATTEGVWPYAYNQCDAGITPNQSSADGISYLPGQRLNKCTCSGQDHPNPGVGRGAPEIDIIEGTVDTNLAIGAVSQSLQLAPFDLWYMVDYNFIEIYNTSTTQMNSWAGGPLQQAVSGVTILNNNWYELSSERAFQSFAVQYLSDDDDGYIQWFVSKDPVYKMHRQALGPNGNIGDREISKEPMSIIMNLGISTSWVYIDWVDLIFPAHFEIDYVRIYQPPGSVSITCDPSNYPTYDYINNHPEPYWNANMTAWSDTKYSWPKNSLMNGCKT